MHVTTQTHEQAYLSLKYKGSQQSSQIRTVQYVSGVTEGRLPQVKKQVRVKLFSQISTCNSGFMAYALGAEAGLDALGFFAFTVLGLIALGALGFVAFTFFMPAGLAAFTVFSVLQGEELLDIDSQAITA
jgi:hypothetical protein